MAHAEALYFMFLDGDDEFSPDYCEVMHDAIDFMLYLNDYFGYVYHDREVSNTKVPFIVNVLSALNSLENVKQMFWRQIVGI